MPNVDINGTVVAFPDELSPDDLNKAVASASKMQPQSNPSFAQKTANFLFKTPALPIAGATIGGMAGAGIGSIPLAGLGAAGGEAIRQLGSRALGMPTPQTSTQAATKIGVQGAIGAAGEGLAQVATGGLRLGAEALAPAGAKALDALSAATGVQIQGFKNLMEKPSLFLTATEGRIKAIGQKIGSIIDGAIENDMTPTQAAESLVERAFRTPAGARNAAKKVALKFARGQEVGDSEVALANRAINTAISNTNDDGTRALLQGQKKVFQDYLAKNLPDLKALNSQFSELKSVNAFRSLGRLNKSGDTSRLGMMFLVEALSHPIRLLTSPAVVGGAMAAGSGMANAVMNPAVNRPLIQALLNAREEQ